ncbi:MAG TPA: antitoxin Xre/MbcA/ParS toxin-binding domain-containing protein [Verrucomicrobiae bacterium]
MRPSAIARSKQKERVLRDLVHGLVRGGAATESARDVIMQIRAGLPIAELNALQASMDLPLEDLALKLGISKATLHRRKVAGRLAPEESDRVVRFARLMGRAMEVFGNEMDAKKWLGAAQYGLGGAVPLDYAETEVGAREVENLLGRIEHGVYS